MEKDMVLVMRSAVVVYGEWLSTQEVCTYRSLGVLSQVM